MPTKQELDRYDSRWVGPDGTLFKSMRLVGREDVVSILFTAYAYDRTQKSNLEYCLTVDRAHASGFVLDALVNATREWFELMFYYGDLWSTQIKSEGSRVVPNTLCRVVAFTQNTDEGES